MTPPPVTPSPHRFVTTVKGPKQPSSLGPLQHQTPHTQTSRQQFAPTPRFSLNSSRKHTLAEDPSQLPHQSSSSPFIARRLLQKPTFSKQKSEDIEEASSDPEAYAPTSHLDPFIHNPQGNAKGPTNPLNAFSPLPDSKRRRLHPPTPHEPISISSSCSEPSSSPPSPLPRPTTPPPPPPPPPPPRPSHIPSTNTLPRFISATAPTTRLLSPSLPTRPHFILPSSPPPPTSIPPAFSPHRRGAKYIPGGLAATVLEWVLEASQTSYTQARSRSAEGAGAWDLNIIVEEFRESDRMLLVREKVTGKGWVLTGSGTGRGEGLRNGCVIVVRRPVWEVKVEGEGWGVGVEWKVLGGG